MKQPTQWKAQLTCSVIPFKKIVAQKDFSRTRNCPGLGAEEKSYMFQRGFKQGSKG